MPNSRELEIYDPQSSFWTSYLKLWGTRGSVPVSGSHYTSFGGNTCCLEIRDNDKVTIIDAGTGIRALGDELMSSDIREIHLFFGHTHWDHLIGFPFFLPLYDPDFVVHIYAAERKQRKIEDALIHVLRPDHFPVQLDEMKADFQFHTLEPHAPINIGNLQILCVDCDHPGGALGFKLKIGGQTIGYTTDNEFLKGYRGPPTAIKTGDPLLEPYREFIDFFHRCDLFIHEAQYTPREYGSKIGWGHSSISNATLLAKLVESGMWFVVHHDPAADDEKLRRNQQLIWKVMDDMQWHCQVTFTYDGMLLPL